MINNYLISGRGIISCFTLEGKSLLVQPDHPNYERIKTAVMAGHDSLEQLVNRGFGIMAFTEGNVQFEGGNVLYKGNAVHNVLTDRILEMMRLELPYMGMIRFLDNLMLNPSAHSVAELYNFLENALLPITDDGHYLAYKKLDWHPDTDMAADGWMVDCYSGKIAQRVGNDPPPIPRNMVDDDWRLACSSGYHIGSLDYTMLRSVQPGDSAVIVKIHPKNAVACNGEFQKMRVTEYTILSMYEGPLESPVYAEAKAGAVPVAVLPVPAARTEDDPVDADVELGSVPNTVLDVTSADAHASMMRVMVLNHRLSERSMCIVPDRSKKGRYAIKNDKQECIVAGFKNLGEVSQWIDSNPA